MRKLILTVMVLGATMATTAATAAADEPFALTNPVTGDLCEGPCIAENLAGGFQIGVNYPPYSQVAWCSVSFDLNVNPEGVGHAINQAIPAGCGSYYRTPCSDASQDPIPWPGHFSQPEAGEFEFVLEVCIESEYGQETERTITLDVTEHEGGVLSMEQGEGIPVGWEGGIGWAEFDTNDSGFALTPLV